MIRTQKINDKKVEKMYKPPKKLIAKHHDLFKDLYPNIFICAKKNTGKTNLMFYIMKESIDKNTEVVFFVSTLNNDPTYEKIIDYLDKKNIVHHDFNTLKDYENNYLKTMIDNLKERGEQDKEQLEHEKSLQEVVEKKLDEKKKYHIVDMEFTEEEKEIVLKIRRLKKKKKRPENTTPKYFVVFDDISAEIKHSQHLASFVKMNRQFKAMTIICSQYPNDIPPEVRTNIDVMLLLTGHNREKLKTLYEIADAFVDFGTFRNLYYDATSREYEFLYVDKGTEFRKNFDEKYIF